MGAAGAVSPRQRFVRFKCIKGQSSCGISFSGDAGKDGGREKGREQPLSARLPVSGAGGSGWSIPQKDAEPTHSAEDSGQRRGLAPGRAGDAEPSQPRTGL